MGVWIETRSRYRQLHNHRVTPYVGVWIETVSVGTAHFPACVTPYVGVWIETIREAYFDALKSCHSLCGSVD